jgi:hypothetical protein
MQPEALNVVHVTVMGVPHELHQLVWAHGETSAHDGVESTMV